MFLEEVRPRSILCLPSRLQAGAFPEASRSLVVVVVRGRFPRELEALASSVSYAASFPDLMQVRGRSFLQCYVSHVVVGSSIDLCLSDEICHQEMTCQSEFEGCLGTHGQIALPGSHLPTKRVCRLRKTSLIDHWLGQHLIWGKQEAVAPLYGGQGIQILELHRISEAKPDRLLTSSSRLGLDNVWLTGQVKHSSPVSCVPTVENSSPALVSACDVC